LSNLNINLNNLDTPLIFESTISPIDTGCRNKAPSFTKKLDKETMTDTESVPSNVATDNNSNSMLNGNVNGNNTNLSNNHNKYDNGNNNKTGNRDAGDMLPRFTIEEVDKVFLTTESVYNEKVNTLAERQKHLLGFYQSSLRKCLMKLKEYQLYIQNMSCKH